MLKPKADLSHLKNALLNWVTWTQMFLDAPQYAFWLFGAEFLRAHYEGWDLSSRQQTTLPMMLSVSMFVLSCLGAWWLLAGGSSINIHPPSLSASQHNKSEGWKCQRVRQVVVSAGFGLSVLSRKGTKTLQTSRRKELWFNLRRVISLPSLILKLHI